MTMLNYLGHLLVPHSHHISRLGHCPRLHTDLHICSQIVHLSASDVAQLDALHKQPGKHRSLLGYIHGTGEWGPGVFGWGYEMLGWCGMREGGAIS